MSLTLEAPPECLLADRLREKIVPAGLHAVVVITGQGAGGKGDAGDGPACPQTLDLSRCFEPARAGHLTDAQDRVPRLQRSELDGRGRCHPKRRVIELSLRENTCKNLA